MQSIVHGLKRDYRHCLDFENADIHMDGPRQKQLRPFGTPEFYLLDAQDQVLYVWIGLTDVEEFTAVFDPLCG